MGNKCVIVKIFAKKCCLSGIRHSLDIRWKSSWFGGAGSNGCGGWVKP